MSTVDPRDVHPGGDHLHDQRIVVRGLAWQGDHDADVAVLGHIAEDGFLVGVGSRVSEFERSRFGAQYFGGTFGDRL